jgi:3D (Asp-Asp-Asp) domain-containing protein
MHGAPIALTRGLLVVALAALALGAGFSGRAQAASGGGGASAPSKPPSGGASATGRIPAKPKAKPKPTTPAPQHNGRRRWLTGVTITEYWPAPESWFSGALVSAPGLPGKHRVDWLYSATGMSMEGEGIGLDGRMYHIASLGNAGWVTAAGKPTSAAKNFSAGAPYWRAGGFWRTIAGAVTFPLAVGGWSAGVGHKYVPLKGVTFAPGASLPLRSYQSVAVDPRVIPLGSRVYVPAYAHDGHGGWFTAQETGGAINGHHIDVFRSPPATPGTNGQYLTGQRILVIKPAT